MGRRCKESPRWYVESFCERSAEVSQQLRKRKVDICCLQGVRWSEQETRFGGIRVGDISLEIMMEWKMLKFSESKTMQEGCGSLKKVTERSHWCWPFRKKF